MASIQPTQSESRHHPPESQPPPLIYQIVASEQLPCFDPTITIRSLLMSRDNATRLSRFSFKAKPVLVPAYFVGLVLRIVQVFAPVPVGEFLAVISTIFQVPAMFLAIMAFRFEYVKVLVHTFEFYFLALTATLWVSCSTYYIRDLRAVLLSIVWVDFIDLVLIEAYFGDSKSIFLVAIASGLYLLSLTVKISLGEPNDSRIQERARLNQMDPLTVKDVLANAMGTMLTLMIRLAYRKYNIMKNELHGASWTQSIGYRCRIALSATQFSSPIIPVKVLLQHTPSVPSSRRLPMRIVKIPTLFHSQSTAFPRIGSTRDLKRWQIALLLVCGGIGYTMSTFAMASTSSNGGSTSHNAIPVVAITGLVATLLFFIWIVSCCQQQLLLRLATTFDFVFLYTQLVASHISVCDLLRWDWVVCCEILAEFLWMNMVLILDALTPAMKTRLRLKTWYGAPILLLHTVKQALFLTDIAHGNRGHIQNRLLIDHSFAGYEVQFRVFPFLFSREITIILWCVRIVYRIKRRSTENDLIMLLGSVEYNCQLETLRSITPKAPAAASI